MIDIDVGFRLDPRILLGDFIANHTIDVLVQVRRSLPLLSLISSGRRHLHHEPHSLGVENLVHALAPKPGTLSVQRQRASR
jgi:hypothetical protein